MKILVVGSTDDLAETKGKFGAAHDYRLADVQGHVDKFFGECEVVFDFTIVQDRSRLNLYQEQAGLPVFLNASTTTLAQMTGSSLSSGFFGFCGMRTFFNREILEVSVQGNLQLDNLRSVCSALNTKYQVVADRVGLVTPRVICMIINEAYYTVQEGTASRDDIDSAMKLGTNYPFGPFEWAERIGVGNVCKLLNAVYADTQDPRYKICSLLVEESRMG